ncbi:MAG: hypothetical protein P8Y73_05825 [Desulfuromonadales bacterium]|jgi:hypothetical protein
MDAETNPVVDYPGPVVQRAQIVNRLNKLHFRSEPVLVVLRHKQHAFTLHLKAVPEICDGTVLRARWVDAEDIPNNLHQFDLVKIVIPDIAAALKLTSETVWLEPDVLQVEIPIRLRPIASRAVCRHPGSPAITTRLTQHSICFEGRLVDYSPRGMKLAVQVAERQSFYMFAPNREVSLNLERNGKTLFAGPVTVVRSEGDPDRLTVVVAPLEDCTPRYQPKEERTRRYAISPAPDISFTHPLTDERTTLPVLTLAALGLSVQEDPERAQLLPGLVIENITLNVCGSHFVTFTGQVVSRRAGDEVVCGIAILDISVDDHHQLIGLVHRAEDDHAYLRLNKDPDKFFEFLFETGFLYPEKYKMLHQNRDALLDAYHKLYLNPNHIARCFVYLENNSIYGHVSALKIYRNTWLNHHHAALSNRKAGFKVLRQISEFHTKSFMLNPLHMRYVVGIWRPNNDFPAKFFGRFKTTLDNPQLCSIDTFSYLTVNLAECTDADDRRGPWELTRATRQDLREFEGYYQQRSGGLLTKAFDLTPENFEDRSISEEYAATGLKRERYLYAVRYGLDLKALVEIQDTNLGLNLSELTSAVYIYVLDEEMVTPKILDYIKCMVAGKTQRESTTIMLYPHTYLERYLLEAEKDYNVWILNLNVEATDAYLKHLSRYCR